MSTCSVSPGQGGKSPGTRRKTFVQIKDVLKRLCPTEYIAQHGKQLRAFDEVVPRRLYLTRNFIPIFVCQLQQLVIKRSVFYI